LGSAAGENRHRSNASRQCGCGRRSQRVRRRSAARGIATDQSPNEVHQIEECASRPSPSASNLEISWTASRMKLPRGDDRRCRVRWRASVLDWVRPHGLTCSTINVIPAREVVPHVLEGGSRFPHTDAHLPEECGRARLNELGVQNPDTNPGAGFGFVLVFDGPLLHAVGLPGASRPPSGLSSSFTLTSRHIDTSEHCGDRRPPPCGRQSPSIPHSSPFIPCVRPSFYVELQARSLLRAIGGAGDVRLSSMVRDGNCNSCSGQYSDEHRRNARLPGKHTRASSRKHKARTETDGSVCGHRRRTTRADTHRGAGSRGSDPSVSG